LAIFCPLDRQKELAGGNWPYLTALL